MKLMLLLSSHGPLLHSLVVFCFFFFFSSSSFAVCGSDGTRNSSSGWRCMLIALYKIHSGVTIQGRSGVGMRVASWETREFASQVIT